MEFNIKMKSLPSTSTNVNDATHSFCHLNVFLVVDDKIALVKYSLEFLQTIFFYNYLLNCMSVLELVKKE